MSETCASSNFRNLNILKDAMAWPELRLLTVRAVWGWCGDLVGSSWASEADRWMCARSRARNFSSLHLSFLLWKLSPNHCVTRLCKCRFANSRPLVGIRSCHLALEVLEGRLDSYAVVPLSRGHVWGRVGGWPPSAVCNL